MAKETRYARQESFAPIGPEGQRRIREGAAVVVGVGATGSVVAPILARAGVGLLRVIDRDIVEATNLQRQALYTDEDAREARPKAETAAQRLRAMNPDVRVEAACEDLDARSAARLLAGATVIVDGTDNFETRLLVNDLAVRLGIPWIYAGVIGSEGHAMAILPGETACFRCYVPEAPPPGAVDTCDTAGVIAPAVHAVGGFAACMALQVLAGRRAAVPRRLLTLDVWAQRVHDVLIEKDPACPCCALRRFDFLEGAAGAPAAALCGRDAVHVRAPAGVLATGLDLAALARRLEASGDGVVRAGPVAVRITAPPIDATFFADGRAIVKGTGDIGRARALYARYVGT